MQLVQLCKTLTTFFDYGLNLNMLIWCNEGSAEQNKFSLFILSFIIWLIHWMPLEWLNIWWWTKVDKMWVLQKRQWGGESKNAASDRGKFPLLASLLFGQGEKEKFISKSYSRSISGLIVIHIISWRIWEAIFGNQLECFQLRRNVKFLSYPAALRSLQHATYLKPEEGLPPDLFLFHPLVSFH